MIEQSRLIRRFSRLITAMILILVLLLLSVGWYQVLEQFRTIEQTTIAAYQHTQLELVRSVARHIDAFVEDQVENHGTSVDVTLETEIFKRFIAPIHLLQNGDAWIYAPSHVVFDPSSDFPAEYVGKSMAEIFELQKENGASHYEEMTAAVMTAREDVGWYIWLPEKGKEIAAWTPVRAENFVWTVGVSTPLNEILDATGASRQRQVALVVMAIATLLAFALMAIWLISLIRASQAEQQLALNQEAMQRTQKLESLGVMAGGIAHDFNNLLVAMLGQSSLAMHKLDKEHPARAHIEKSVKAAERAASLTQQLLAYAGKTQITPELLDVNQQLEESLHLFEVMIPHHVRLVRELHPTLPLIKADAGQFQQILMNLVMNGSEAISGPAGTVTLRSYATVIDAGATIYSSATGTTLTAGPYVVIEVQDSGRGMDEATLQRIFDPFYTTKATGRGLGLAAVIGIVRSHHGNLIVESKVGEGTCFRLFFPANTAEAWQALSAQSTESKPQRLDGMVLLIDDDAQIHDFVSDALQTKEIKLLHAHNGEDGVKLFGEKGDEVSLVLLDLLMPGSSGEQVLPVLRQMNANIPIIVSSGYHDRASQQELLKQGAFDFLSKPYDAEALINALSRALKNTVDGRR